jgi:signal transduction histidine kinase
LLQQGVTRFAAVAEARRIDLRADVPADPRVINAPNEWVDRLVRVLLDNACKYTPEKGYVIVTLHIERAKVRLQVQDSRPGIPAQDRHLIFDRFRRATDQASGAGLGLGMADSTFGLRAAGGKSLIRRPEAPA